MKKHKTALYKAVFVWLFLNSIILHTSYLSSSFYKDRCFFTDYPIFHKFSYSLVVYDTILQIDRLFYRFPHANIYLHIILQILLSFRQIIGGFTELFLFPQLFLSDFIFIIEFYKFRRANMTGNTSLCISNDNRKQLT